MLVLGVLRPIETHATIPIAIELLLCDGKDAPCMLRVARAAIDVAVHDFRLEELIIEAAGGVAPHDCQISTKNISVLVVAVVVMAMQEGAAELEIPIRPQIVIPQRVQ